MKQEIFYPSPPADLSSFSPDIVRVLHDAFGGASVDAMSQIPGGRSGATLLSLMVAGNAYILKRIDPTRPMHQDHAEREYLCATIAAERGIAPKIRHVDMAAGILIMERIIGTPLGRSPEQIQRVTRALRQLHTGPAFPTGTDVAGVVRSFDTHLRAWGREGIPPSLLGILDEIERVTERFARTAPCHNDLNPTNILETEDGVYFLDWDTACMADPFLDLAELGVFGFPLPEQREALLEAYLERRPTEEDVARLTLARPMALGLYAAGFTLVALLAGRPGIDTADPLSIPALLLMLKSEQDRAAPEIVAASLLAEMDREVHTDRFEAAKRILTPY